MHSGLGEEGPKATYFLSLYVCLLGEETHLATDLASRKTKHTLCCVAKTWCKPTSRQTNEQTVGADNVDIPSELSSLPHGNSQPQVPEEADRTFLEKTIFRTPKGATTKGDSPK